MKLLDLLNLASWKTKLLISRKILSLKWLSNKCTASIGARDKYQLHKWTALCLVITCSFWKTKKGEGEFQGGKNDMDKFQFQKPPGEFLERIRYLLFTNSVWIKSGFGHSHFILTALQIPQRRNDFNNLETIFFVMAVNILGVYFSLTTTMINFISTV